MPIEFDFFGEPIIPPTKTGKPRRSRAPNIKKHRIKIILINYYSLPNETAKAGYLKKLKLKHEMLVTWQKLYPENVRKWLKFLEEKK